jgi:hypothetical protein
MSHCNLGLSCEPVKEEEPKSILGELIDSIIIIKNRIDALHEHKLRQIDENRKISRRVDNIDAKSAYASARADEISKYINERIDNVEKHINEIFKHARDGLFCLEKRIEKLEQSREAHSRNHKDLFERIEKLEQLNQQCFDANPIKEIYEKFEKIESKIACLMQKSSLNDEKRPFKCPVCSGTGNHPDQSPRLMCKVFTKTGLYVCMTCDGKGIVWG